MNNDSSSTPLGACFLFWLLALWETEMRCCWLLLLLGDRLSALFLKSWDIFNPLKSHCWLEHNRRSSFFFLFLLNSQQGDICAPDPGGSVTFLTSQTSEHEAGAAALFEMMWKRLGLHQESIMKAPLAWWFIFICFLFFWCFVFFAKVCNICVCVSASMYI